MGSATREHVLALLGDVLDPEVPALDVVSLGIVRDVAVAGNRVEVTITPTYSGCPALRRIENDIVAHLAANGMPGATIKTVLAPAWTTDWMTDDAREKLRVYGIAPPVRPAAANGGEVPASVPCPQCGSVDTALRSAFGSTACKALYVCESCREPFEHFKCI